MLELLKVFTITEQEKQHWTSMLTLSHLTRLIPATEELPSFSRLSNIPRYMYTTLIWTLVLLPHARQNFIFYILHLFIDISVLFTHC